MKAERECFEPAKPRDLVPGQESRLARGAGRSGRLGCLD